jgi:hypothetical protein
MNSGPDTFMDPVSGDQAESLDSEYEVEGGFPHSEILGSKLVRSSPRLIAAYHVLHRLSAPRHPPNALKALDHSHDRCPPPQGAGTGHRKTRSPDLSIQASYACRTHPGSPRRRRRSRFSRLSSQPRHARPLHDAKYPRNGHRAARETALRRSGRTAPAARRAASGWWSQTGSNRRPHACKARALPTELWPRSWRSQERVRSWPQAPARASARSAVPRIGAGGRSASPRPCGPRVDAPEERDGPFAIRHSPFATTSGGPGTTRTSDLTLIRGAL